MTKQLVSIELPESIDNLTELKKFYCHNNKLTGEYKPSSPRRNQYAVLTE